MSFIIEFRFLQTQRKIPQDEPFSFWLSMISDLDSFVGKMWPILSTEYRQGLKRNRENEEGNDSIWSRARAHSGTHEENRMREGR